MKPWTLLVLALVAAMFAASEAETCFPQDVACYSPPGPQRGIAD